MKKILSTIMVCVLLIGLLPMRIDAQTAKAFYSSEEIIMWENTKDIIAGFDENV